LSSNVPVSIPTPGEVSRPPASPRGPSTPPSSRKWRRLAAAGGLLLLWGQAVTAGTEPVVYFLVGERIPRIPVPGARPPESYVLPLSDPEAIAHARWLIATDPLNTRYVPYPPPPDDPPTHYKGVTVHVRVAKTRDWSNRDFYRPGFPAWSWRVVELVGFPQVISGDLDAIPSAVEQWMAEASERAETTFAALGFTVVRELGPGMLYLSATRQGEQIQFSWSGVWADADYSIEAAETLDSPDWVPVVAGLTPGKTNVGSMPLPPDPVRFYRLRAEPPAN
jgi:hypothetical protein